MFPVSPSLPPGLHLGSEFQGPRAAAEGVVRQRVLASPQPDNCCCLKAAASAAAAAAPRQLQPTAEAAHFGSCWGPVKRGGGGGAGVSLIPEREGGKIPSPPPFSSISENQRLFASFLSCVWRLHQLWDSGSPFFLLNSVCHC